MTIHPITRISKAPLFALSMIASACVFCASAFAAPPVSTPSFENPIPSMASDVRVDPVRTPSYTPSVPVQITPVAPSAVKPVKAQAPSLAASASNYCTNLSFSLSSLPKYSFDAHNLIALLKEPCIAEAQQMARLAQHQAKLTSSGSSVGSLTLIASENPQSALELSTFYSHLFSNVFVGIEATNGNMLDASDLILYQSLYKKLKVSTTDILLADLAHLYMTKEALGQLKPASKPTVVKLTDLKALGAFERIVDALEKHISNYHARLAMHHQRLSFALQNIEQFQGARRSFDVLLPMILEQPDPTNPFYKKTLSAFDCNFMNHYAPVTWDQQRQALKIQCAPN